MRREWAIVTVVVLTLCGAESSSGQRETASPALPTAVPRPGWLCGAPAGQTRFPGVRALSPLADSAPLAYEQFPRILSPTETGTIRLVAELVGDVATAVFRRSVPSLETGYTSELWARSGTRTVDGRLVSVFDQQYPGAILDDLLIYSHGNDSPQVPLGRLEVPGSNIDDPASAALVTLWLRLAPTNLPVSTVRTISSASTQAAQYASHVVNIVVSGFGDRQVLNGSQAFEFEQAAQTFYEHFADIYHALSFIPRRSPFAEYAAFNVNVKNDIEGIGMPVVDDRAAYHSSALRSVQLYTAGFAGRQETTVHQTGHHWGDETHLATIAGVAAAGHQPDSHTPLLDGGATLIGAVLEGTREVEQVPSEAGSSDPTYRIAQATAPVAFHPLQLYRMGFLEPAAIPDITVFSDQAQFGPDRVGAPEVGTPVTGGRRTLNINQIMAALGPRRGPTFTEWRQAFVVVSDELISQREMDYYNFYAQRVAATGAQSYDGYGSFAEATGRRVSLQTSIDTRDAAGHPAIPPTAVVGDVPFGPRDWRGLVFDAPVPSRVSAGQQLTLHGRIDTEILAGSYEFVILRAIRFGDSSSTAVTSEAAVSAGRFSLPLLFDESQTGGYELDIFVFADADSPAIPTSVMTPFFVE